MAYRDRGKARDLFDIYYLSRTLRLKRVAELKEIVSFLDKPPKDWNELSTYIKRNSSKLRNS